MKDNYDFSNAIKNPYAEKLKNGFSVTVHYDSFDEFWEDSKDDELEPTDVQMQVAEKNTPYNPQTPL